MENPCSYLAFVLPSLLCLAVACGDSGSGGAGGGAAGGAAPVGGGGDGGQPSGDGGSGGAVIGALTHCLPDAFRCFYDTGFYDCTEYSAADAATYQSICEDGGTWEAGHCDETDVVGACLPLSFCNGMGIGYLYDAGGLADAQESCSSTGGTWEAPAL